MNALDTSFIIDYWNGEPYIREFLERELVDPTIPAIARFELYLGALLSDSPTEDVSTVSADLDWAGTLPFTDDVAQRAAHIDATLTGRGAKINLADVLIAATAVEAGATLVTTDSHFDRIEGLAISNPRADEHH